MSAVLEQEKSYNHCPLTPLAERFSALLSAVATICFFGSFIPLPEMLKSELSQLQAAQPSTGNGFIFLGVGPVRATQSPPISPRDNLPKELPSHWPTVSGYWEAREARPARHSCRGRPEVQFCGTADGSASGGTGRLVSPQMLGLCFWGPSSPPGSIADPCSLFQGGVQRHRDVSNSNWGSIEKFLNTKSP